MASRQDYKIRRVVKNDKLEACAIAVPVEIAEVLPEDTRFTVELTDEGILFRPKSSSVEATNTPTWVQELKKD